MQETSELYKKIFSNPSHRTESMLKINGVTYDIHDLKTMKTSASIFPGESPELGACVARRIDVTLRKPKSPIPPMAKLEPFVRIADDTGVSEWLPKGKFYVDTRWEDDTALSTDQLNITGFCSILAGGEADCPISGIDWPATDISVVRLISEFMNVGIDPRTESLMTKRYTINLPTEYSCREVLSGIAAMYGGSFIMSDNGELLLIRMCGIPTETYYLTTNEGYAITFGGDRILV